MSPTTAADAGIKKVAEAITETTGSVKIDDAWPARCLSVTIGHGDRTRLLQCADVVDVAGLDQRVH
jgi:membrane protein implicated in regulation of membrane protease activity